MEQKKFHFFVFARRSGHSYERASEGRKVTSTAKLTLSCHEVGNCMAQIITKNHMSHFIQVFEDTTPQDAVEHY